MFFANLNSSEYNSIMKAVGNNARTRRILNSFYTNESSGRKSKIFKTNNQGNIRNVIYLASKVSPNTRFYRVQLGPAVNLLRTKVIPNDAKTNINLPKNNFNRISENPNLEAFNMHMLNSFEKDQYGYYRLRNANVKNVKRFANSLNKMGLRAIAERIHKRIPKKQSNPSLKNVKKSIATLTAAKKVLHRALASRAGRAYTHVWDEVIAEANNIKPKTSLLPPGFRGTVNQKYNRARLYKQRIIQWAHTHPKKYNRPLYRGVYGAEAKMFRSSDVVVKNNLTSFSKSLDIALGFSSRGNKKAIPLILKINPLDKLPSIDYTNNLFTTKYTKEQEVLLPPGVFEVVRRPKITKLFQNVYGNFTPIEMIIVKFRPNPNQK